MFTLYESGKGEVDHMAARLKALFTMAALVALAGCGSASADDAEDSTGDEGFVRTINVETATVATEEFIEEIRLTSVAMANQDVLIEAEESGTVRELYFDRGDRVRVGEAILKIDDRILMSQVDQARAVAELADQTWTRRQRLWEEDRVGSEIAYLETRFAAEQTAATLAGLEERLARTVIRAPFSGILDERHVDIGTSVGPGKAVARLVDLDPIKVFAGVPERYAADLSVGDGAQMVFEALGSEVYTAPIRYVGSTINPQNRTFPIEVRVPNADGAIKPQMVANMSVTRRQVDDAIVVPQDALVRVQDGYVAFVAVERDGATVAEARVVALGPSRRNLVVVEDGVYVGERLIVVGQRSVADGDRVNVVMGPGGADE